MAPSQSSFSGGRYQLIPRTLIFLTCGESVLLLKGAADKRLFADQYNGIGGHIERGEDVLSAAFRELKEETGLTPQTLRLCGVVTVDTEEQVGIGIFVFKGTSEPGQLRSSQEGKPEWVPVKELKNKSLVKDLEHLLPRVLRHQAGDPPISGHYRSDSAGKIQARFTTI